ncbi:hypothetical protein GCM10010833_07240 [Blastomonas aquatica]|uniref:DUF4352 domain-containing protein n=2 Tax=Blastomonas aquatica TaxID=1510276 RepID=A0ABQ1IXV4_9SPHN|nr:hypothetical protein GCM10010833_07240 [Blastomonas aquatica]
MLLSLPILLVAGCGSDPASDPSASNPDTPAPAAAQPQPGRTNGGSLWQGGEQQSIDLQSAHPNGVVLQLTSIQSRQMETAIGIRVLNGRDRAIELNRFNNRNGYIVLDSGERLYLSPPANNTKVSIPAGQTFEGELVFLGRLPPVQSAVLILNENASADNEHTSTPGFRIDLPLTGAVS